MTENAPNTPKPVEKKPPSLKEIVEDKELGRGFNQWLDGKAQQELAARLLTGQLEKADVPVLAEEREKFLKQQAESRKIKEQMLSAAALEGFVALSPELKQVESLVGMDGVRDALETVISEKALLEGGVHEEIYRSFEMWQAAVKDYEGQQNKLAEFLERAHLTSEEGAEVAGIAELEERKQRIAQLWEQKQLQQTEKKKFLWFEWDEKTWTEEQQALLQQTAEDFSGTAVKAKGATPEWKRINEALRGSQEFVVRKQQEIAEDLKFVISEDGTREIGRIIAGEKKSAGQMMSFGELRQDMAKEKNPDTVAEDFFKYAADEFADYIADGGIALDTVDEKDAAVGSFFEEFKNERVGVAADGKGGIWKAVYEATVKPFFDDVLQDLKTNDRMKINKDKSGKYHLGKKTK